jgi:geranylgeranyl diphosphate synthase type II
MLLRGNRMMAIGAVTTFVLEDYAARQRALIEPALERYTTAPGPKPLWDSMRYSVLSGGKRFRAMLCLASAEAIANGISDRALTIDDATSRAMPCACAIEMVHAMSLIHDDLPCMDNDDFRRGKPTNHKVYGEALALLAGDGLLAYASEILIRETPKSVSAQTILDVAAELSRATGPLGMVGGQVEDCIATGLMSCEVETSSKSEDKLTLLESIHKKKTGALLRFSAWSGARLMEADEHVLNMLLRYGDILGIAFQIADDLLDITGDIQTLGKTPGKDVATGKVTWVTVYGVEGAKKALQDLEREGNEVLNQTGCGDAAIAPLSALLAYAIHRTN